MSGGSYDYVSFKMDEAASTLRSRHPTVAHVLALASLLDRLSKVMHDIEWADSCDTSWDAELDAAIRSVVSPADELREATAQATTALAGLNAALARLPESGVEEPSNG